MALKEKAQPWTPYMVTHIVEWIPDTNNSKKLIKLLPVILISSFIVNSIDIIQIKMASAIVLFLVLGFIIYKLFISKTNTKNGLIELKTTGFAIEKNSLNLKSDWTDIERGTLMIVCAADGNAHPTSVQKERVFLGFEKNGEKYLIDFALSDSGMSSSALNICKEIEWKYENLTVLNNFGKENIEEVNQIRASYR